ncbi:helix-turn-helix domain-containing protein [Streptomyces sp. NPDC018833]|uniref:helix-turn-helix domain-containing protein n=1 Tax=Streptomyces sp. NPDC018833 TaxID=3365053 RepID=UPI00379ED323
MAQNHILRLAQVRAAVANGEAKRLREAAQLSIGEVAEACGVDQSTVWRWERGTRKPHGEKALRYGDLINSLRLQMREAA